MSQEDVSSISSFLSEVSLETSIHLHFFLCFFFTLLFPINLMPLISNASKSFSLKISYSMEISYLSREFMSFQWDFKMRKKEMGLAGYHELNNGFTFSQV